MCPRIVSDTCNSSVTQWVTVNERKWMRVRYFPLTTAAAAANNKRPLIHTGSGPFPSFFLTNWSTRPSFLFTPFYSTPSLTVHAIPFSVSLTTIVVSLFKPTCLPAFKKRGLYCNWVSRALHTHAHSYQRWWSMGPRCPYFFFFSSFLSISLSTNDWTTQRQGRELCFLG